MMRRDSTESLWQKVMDIEKKKRNQRKQKNNS